MCIDLLSFLYPPRITAGVATKEWVGKRVIAKYGAPLRRWNRWIDGNLFKVYTVTKKRGPWLWVVAPDSAGWLLESKALLFDEAIEFYQDEIEATPKKWFAWIHRGIWQQLQGQSAEAIADFTEAIRLAPHDVNGFYLRACIHHLLSQYEQAIADYGNALVIVPSYSSVWLGRGMAELALGKLEQALADLNEALSHDSRSAEAYVGRSAVYLALLDEQRALADCRRAKRLQPRHPGPHIACGNALWAARQFDQALAEYSRALELVPQQVEPYLGRALCRFRRGEYDSAFADVNEALRLAPESFYPLNAKAWFLATCPDEAFRDGDTAVELATRAGELCDWKVPECLGTLSAAHAEAGDFTRAIELQERANGLYPRADDREKGAERLELYRQGRAYRDPVA